MPQPSSVLYFPSIEFQDENFLKRSLLYWDKVKRIVPAGYSPNDSDFVKELRDGGLVQDITVSENTLGVVAERFIDMVNSPSRASGLSPDTYDLTAEAVNTGRLHRSKIYYVLQDIFMDMGFQTGRDNFFEVPSHLAAYYMLVLAIETARSRRIPLATDLEEMWSITPAFVDNNNFAEISADTDGVNCLTSLTVDSIMPERVDDIDAATLISMARDSRHARKALREHIGEFIGRIQTIESREQVMDELDGLVRDIERDKEEYRASQKFLYSGALTSCLNVNIPTLATLYSIGQDNISWGIGSLLFTFVQYIRNCKLLKKARSASYQAYLVGLDRQASGRAIARTPRRISEFIFD